VPKIFANGQFYLSLKTWSHVFLEHNVDKHSVSSGGAMQQSLGGQHWSLSIDELLEKFEFSDGV